MTAAFLILFALGTPVPAHATAPAPADTPSIRAERLRGDIDVDGRLDEAAWDRAQPASGFVQTTPLEGRPATQPTEVRVLYDEDALYVGARLYDERPGTIARQLVRRDEEGAFDYFELALDPNLDRRTGYGFRVSAADVQADAYLFDDTGVDDTWDAVWESAVSVDSLGWTAEIRIPLSQIRFDPSTSAQRWGINFGRLRLATNEQTYFAPISRTEHGFVSRFGDLTGIELAEAPRRLEAVPYVLGRARTAPSEPGNPFFDGTALDAGAGLGLRYGIGGSFSLDLTLNPDFGQVEVDPAVINLSAFETFFPERRPFFVEDARVFDFPEQLFYSRRIGREPQGFEPGDAEFATVPDQTTILGAGKLTGRTNGGLSIGVLGAATAAEKGRAFFGSELVIDTVGGVSDSVLVPARTVAFPVEPRSYYGVVRAEQDLRGGATQVGAIATAVRRDLPADGTFDFLPATAVTAGADFEHTWSNRAWALRGYLSGSYVQGGEEALIRIQRSSTHYFQRPDAADLELDSTATSLRGAAWQLRLQRQGGRHWTGGVWVSNRTPGFDTNDLGFLQSTDQLIAGANVRYRETEPGPILREYSVGFEGNRQWRNSVFDAPLSTGAWARASKEGIYRFDANATFLNYWSIGGNVMYSPRLLSDQLTRGGPLMVDPPSLWVSLGAETDPRRPLALEPEIGWRRGADQYDWEFGVELTYRPAPRLELSAEPAYGWTLDARQYVATVDTLAHAPTYGRRYIFSDLERRSLSLETRLDVAFTPTLTLQLFAQPLVSTGDYRQFKQLAAAETFDFEALESIDAGLPDGERARLAGASCIVGSASFFDFDGDLAPDFCLGPRDFNIRSLRGNAVLRWEYRPGSTVYLVWQQSRFDRLPTGAFGGLDDLGALFEADPENVFIIKATTWLGL